MQRARMGYHAFAKRRAVGNDHVEIGEVETLERQGIQQQEGLVVAPDQRQPLHEGRPHIQRADRRRHLLGPVD